MPVSPSCGKKVLWPEVVNHWKRVLHFLVSDLPIAIHFLTLSSCHVLIKLLRILLEVQWNLQVKILISIKLPGFVLYWSKRTLTLMRVILNFFFSCKRVSSSSCAPVNTKTSILSQKESSWVLYHTWQTLLSCSWTKVVCILLNQMSLQHPSHDFSFQDGWNKCQVSSCSRDVLKLQKTKTPQKSKKNPSKSVFILFLNILFCFNFSFWFWNPGDSMLYWLIKTHQFWPDSLSVFTHWWVQHSCLCKWKSAIFLRNDRHNLIA